MGGDGGRGHGNAFLVIMIVVEGRCQKKRVVTTMVDDTHWQGRSSKRQHGWWVNKKGNSLGGRRGRCALLAKPYSILISTELGKQEIAISEDSCILWGKKHCCCYSEGIHCFIDHYSHKKGSPEHGADWWNSLDNQGKEADWSRLSERMVISWKAKEKPSG